MVEGVVKRLAMHPEYEGLAKDIDVALYARLSHDLHLDFLMKESMNTLNNKFKRYIIHGSHPVLSLKEVLLHEEVRVFTRTI